MMNSVQMTALYNHGTSLPGGTWEGEGLIDDILGTFNSNQLGGIYD